MYAVDLARFATLTRYGELPEFNIEPFDEIQAREILKRQPRLILNRHPSQSWRTSAIRQLQLRSGWISGRRTS